MKLFSSNQGYTLVELVTVMVVIGILAAVAIPNFIDLSNDARTAVTKDEMNSIKRAIVGDSRAVSGGTYVSPGFESDMTALPTTLNSLVTNPTTLNTTQDYDPIKRTGWRGPYIDPSALSSYAKDAWGTAYVYSTSSRLIRSWGPNKTNDAGASDDIDLTF